KDGCQASVHGGAFEVDVPGAIDTFFLDQENSPEVTIGAVHQPLTSDQGGKTGDKWLPAGRLHSSIDYGLCRFFIVFVQILVQKQGPLPKRFLEIGNFDLGLGGMDWWD